MYLCGYYYIKVCFAEVFNFTARLFSSVVISECPARALTCDGGVSVGTVARSGNFHTFPLNYH
jgi:hypothetical protein